MHLIFHGAVTRCVPISLQLQVSACLYVCVVFLVFEYRCSSNIGNNTSMVHRFINLEIKPIRVWQYIFISMLGGYYHYLIQLLIYYSFVAICKSLLLKQMMMTVKWITKIYQSCYRSLYFVKTIIINCKRC